MPRSPILTGLNQSKVRESRDRKTSLNANNNNDLFCWLQKNISPQIEIIESINLSQYFRQTNHIKIPAAERLRKLAIFLEEMQASYDSPMRYWLAINRVYLAALKLNAQDVWIYHSQAAKWNYLGYILEATKEIDESLYQRIIAINNSISKLSW
ncbi:hypothetical protein [Candidatus Uabimicrobium sp. HlEnr_7]|uniref:hypothetical protein n=1 Tax=Candidatus Uabimicrobium helgolandensis TaxID=3095367 RepID=UPI0035579FD1